jgi:hypothetical protein
MNPNDLAAIQRKFPLSAACLKRNQADLEGVRADDPQSTKGGALVGALPRKGKSRKGAVLGVARRHIRFRVFSVHPPDYDGIDVKSLQDCIVKSGLLDGDGWNILYGTVISEKVHTKEEEMTIVEIT